jgi:hypothetical protein
MKPLVRNNSHALGWERAGNASSSGTECRDGGRVTPLAALYEWMLPLTGLLFLADAFSLVKLWPPVQYLLAGIVLGAFAGKSVVVWRERDGRELHPDRIRRIEHSWTLASVALTALAILAQAALA